MRASLGIVVIAFGLAGAVGPAVAQYYPLPPPGYSAAPPCDPCEGEQAGVGGPYEPYPPAGGRFSNVSDGLPPQPMPRLDGGPMLRPPGSIGDTSDVTGSVRTPVSPAPSAGSNRSVIASLPPEDQPETGPRKELPPQFRRQVVDYMTVEPAGTIIIDTPHTYLYFALGNGKAMRYGIGVGREGFTWSGSERISRMKEWPDWFPPREMIDRQPYLPRFMAGGDTNPLGARALYLGNTLYRIHGTNQPSTIGSFVSSGCIRLANEDIADLFGRVQLGTRVVVLPGSMPTTAASQAPIGH